MKKKRSNKNGLLLIYPILPISFNSVPRMGKEREPMKDFDESWEYLKKNFQNENKGNLKKEEWLKLGISLLGKFYPTIMIQRSSEDPHFNPTVLSNSPRNTEIHAYGDAKAQRDSVALSVTWVRFPSPAPVSQLDPVSFWVSCN